MSPLTATRFMVRPCSDICETRGGPPHLLSCIETRGIDGMPDFRAERLDFYGDFCKAYLC